MTTTLAASPMLTMWHQRAAAQDKLATLRLARASCCGCPACHDQDKADALNNQINAATRTIAYLSDRLSTRCP